MPVVSTTTTLLAHHCLDSFAFPENDFPEKLFTSPFQGLTNSLPVAHNSTDSAQYVLIRNQPQLLCLEELPNTPHIEIAATLAGKLYLTREYT